MSVNGGDLAIETRDLYRRFGGQDVLAGVTLEVPAGGVHALVGRNGAGKSTLFRVLLGFLARSSGESRVFGSDSAELPASVRGRVGFVAEGHPLPGWLRVDELAALQRSCHPTWSDEVFGEVTGLFRLPADRRVRQLSRGERAGLALALALAPQPELLLLDEPTLGLDVVASRAFVESLLFAGDREQRTIVYSSHQMAEVERLADRVVVLDRGVVVAAEAADDLRARISGWAVGAWPPGQPLAAIPGLLDARRIDDELHVIALDEADALPARLAALGAREVTPLPLSFERAMDAFLLAGGRAGGDR
jgi:ABC-2 type transport system ATP-binding protein